MVPRSSVSRDPFSVLGLLGSGEEDISPPLPNWKCLACRYGTTFPRTRIFVNTVVRISNLSFAEILFLRIIDLPVLPIYNFDIFNFFLSLYWPHSQFCRNLYFCFSSIILCRVKITTILIIQNLQLLLSKSSKCSFNQNISLNNLFSSRCTSCKSPYFIHIYNKKWRYNFVFTNVHYFKADRILTIFTDP